MYNSRRYYEPSNNFSDFSFLPRLSILAFFIYSNTFCAFYVSYSLGNGCCAFLPKNVTPFFFVALKYRAA